MTSVRAPAVAGSFYFAAAGALADAVDRMLAAAHVPAGPAPAAMLQPHAGHVYSGPVAAAGYRRLADTRPGAGPVAVLCPNHTVACDRIAVSGADVWETPLGGVPVDDALRSAVLDLPGVVADDRPHLREHAVEVHLPFLQRLLDPGWALLPVVVGEVAPDAAAAVVDAVLDLGALLVVSSDLSHYLGYHDARRRDERTVRAILERDAASIGRHDACGSHPIRGYLASRSVRSLTAEVLNVRNSGDTAGPRREVVGYASIVWARPAPERPTPHASMDRTAREMG